MSDIVEIKKARDILIKSEPFSQAIKKVNEAILHASECGFAKAELAIYSGEMEVYEAVASLFECDGYTVDISREIGPKCFMFIEWGFDSKI